MDKIENYIQKILKYIAQNNREMLRNNKKNKENVFLRNN